jgi:hypothetical protein
MTDPGLAPPITLTGVCRTRGKYAADRKSLSVFSFDEKKMVGATGIEPVTPAV